MRLPNRREGVTVFMVLWAAFQVLLSRWSGQKDIIVDVPIGRTRREIEGVVGFFAQHFGATNGLSGDPAFQELLQRVKRLHSGHTNIRTFPSKDWLTVIAGSQCHGDRVPLFTGRGSMISLKMRRWRTILIPLP